MFPVTSGVLENFVAGVTATLWFLPLVAAVAGWREPPSWLLQGGSVTLIVFVTLAYGLGVIVDGVADGPFTFTIDHWRRGPSQLSGDAFLRLREEALGGFLNEGLRWNDFALGYRSTRIWLDGLEDLGIDGSLASGARAAVDQRYDPAWNTRMGTRSLRSLDRRDRRRVWRTAWHTAFVIIRELRHKAPY